MSVTSLQFADSEPYLVQIEKLTRSHTLRKAESLCKLLRYLADHALAQPGVPLKEYRIAIEVFGRPDDFDPQADSAIRVQAGRLRLKLHEYYSHEGLSDTITIEYSGGVAIVLDASQLMIGAPSKTIKITGTKMNGRTYTVDFDYVPSAASSFEVRTPWAIKDAQGAIFTVISPGAYRITLNARAQEKAPHSYQHGNVILTFAH